MWSFARQPRWMVGHALAVVLLITFVVAGIWQFGRHRERQRSNELTAANTQLAPLTAADLAQTADPASLEWRRLNESANWVPDEAVLVRNRSFNGLGGCHLVAPAEILARTSPPTAVLVTAGWLPLTACDAERVATIAREWLAPDPVALVGWVRPTQERGLFGPTDPPTGRLNSLARLDIARIAQQSSGQLAPVYVELTNHSALAPGPPDAPPLRMLFQNDDHPMSQAGLNSGPHLGYTVQWFTFALIALIGYPIVLWRQAQSHRQKSPADAAQQPTEPAEVSNP